MRFCNLTSDSSGRCCLWPQQKLTEKYFKFFFESVWIVAIVCLSLGIIPSELLYTWCCAVMCAAWPCAILLSSRKVRRAHATTAAVRATTNASEWHTYGIANSRQRMRVWTLTMCECEHKVVLSFKRNWFRRGRKRIPSYFLNLLILFLLLLIRRNSPVSDSMRWFCLHKIRNGDCAERAIMPASRRISWDGIQRVKANMHRSGSIHFAIDKHSSSVDDPYWCAHRCAWRAFHSNIIDKRISRPHTIRGHCSVALDVSRAFAWCVAYRAIRIIFILLKSGLTDLCYLFLSYALATHGPGHSFCMRCQSTFRSIAHWLLATTGFP